MKLKERVNDREGETEGECGMGSSTETVRVGRGKTDREGEVRESVEWALRQRQ